jgi:hypothetical protein
MRGRGWVRVGNKVETKANDVKGFFHLPLVQTLVVDYNDLSQINDDESEVDDKFDVLTLCGRDSFHNVNRLLENQLRCSLIVTAETKKKKKK